MTHSQNRRMLWVARLLVFCLMLWTFGLCGCAPRIEGKYQLRKLESDWLLVPPPYWKQPLDKPLKVRVPISETSLASAPDDCSIGGTLFRLSLTRGGSPKWTATLPSLSAWQSTILSDSFSREFDNFLDQIGQLGSNGCIPARAGGDLEEAIRQSIPVRARDTLYYRYDWSPGAGFIDLLPGMRLRIERAGLISSARTGATSMAYYDITRDVGHAIHFRLAAAKPQHTARDLPDWQLASEVQGMFFAQLFLSGEHVPNNLSYTALLVGTSSREQMQEIEAALQARPQGGCPDGPNSQLRCITFQGSVSVSVQLPVTVNGRRVFVGLDDTVQRLFDESGHRCQFRFLKIQRQFLNHLVPVDFDGAGEPALDLPLAGEDDINCRMPSEAAH